LYVEAVGRFDQHTAELAAAEHTDLAVDYHVGIVSRGGGGIESEGHKVMLGLM
jgi:hypothetical protein